MTIKTVGSLFSGSGCKTMAAVALGYEPVFAIDNWEIACDFHALNVSPHIECMDILEADPHNFPPIDALLASPPCTNFSRANIFGAEQEQDLKYSDKIIEFAEVLQPEFVIIENVEDYKKGQSYLRLMEGLMRLYDDTEAFVWNAADFGLPQTRKRLIIRAAKKGMLKDMIPSHSQKGEELPPWNGWFPAVKDLIGTMEKSSLTKAQRAALRKRKAKLPDGDLSEQRISSPIMLQKIGYGPNGPSVWWFDKPVGSIRATLAEDRKKTKAHPGGYRRNNFMNYYDPITKVVLNVNPQILARLMGFPPEWELPEDIRDAVRIVGNAAPIPLMKAAIAAYDHGG
jgi:DNA (cytosine-5)-methyltransferase 1